MGTGARRRARGPKPVRRPRWWCAACGLILLWIGQSSATFRISITPHDANSLDIELENQADAYYIVYVSPTPDQRGDPVAVWLTPEPVPIDPAQTFLACCVRQVPVDLPQDTDHDGIDDVFELNTTVLDPLDGADAALDPDGDGMDCLQEYQQGSDPGAPPVADAGGVVCLDVYTPMDPA